MDRGAEHEPCHSGVLAGSGEERETDLGFPLVMRRGEKGSIHTVQRSIKRGAIVKVADDHLDVGSGRERGGSIG